MKLSYDEMSIRLYHYLTKAGCQTFEQALAYTPEQLQRVAPIGNRYLKELSTLAKKYGYA